MTLVKTSILTAVSTAIKVLTAFVLNKIVAVYIGPSGLAIIGQFQNFNSIIMNFANGAINTGVIKYTAEYKDDITKKSKLFSTAISISLICSLIIALGLHFFAQQLSIVILKTDVYSAIFSLFGFTIIFFALNTLLMSILNGQREIKKYVLVNIISSLLSLGFTSFLIMQYHLQGALIALVLNQSIIFFVTLLFVMKSSWFKLRYFLKGFDKEISIKLGKYSLMALTSALTVPVGNMVIRNYIGENLGWDSAGYWQGIWYISSMYLLVVTTSLGVYYLPRLSEITDKDELKKEIIDGYKIIMPIVIVMALLIFFFRELAIHIAFTDKFLPMKELFKWQLIGDVIKIASWLIGYVFIAKAKAKVFIYKEIFIILFLTLSSIVFIKWYGLVGATYAFSITYLINFILLFVLFKYFYIKGKI